MTEEDMMIARWGFSSLLVIGSLLAAGANETGGVADNYNYNSYMTNEELWPRFSRENGVKQLLWHHSDIKNMAYYFVYPLFEQLVSEGD